MLLEDRCREFHKYVSANQIPLEAFCVGDENRVLYEMHYAPDRARNIYSHTKSFTVTGVGLAISDGRLSLDDRLTDFFADKLPENPDKNLDTIRLKHILCMSSGFGKALLMGSDRRAGTGAPDYEAYMMSQPLTAVPGEKFCYSSADSILALHMTEKAVGKRMGDFLYERIFAPMGMGWPIWEHDPMGHANGGGGLFLTCTEMMKLGQLYLGGGKWKGMQLLDPAWIKEVSTPRFIFEKSEDPWSVGYGYQFWMSPYPGSYRADGAYGQVTTILPQKGLVVSVQCPENGNFDRVKKALHEHFLTQL